MALLPTLILAPIVVLPLTIKKSLIETPVLTINPLFGDIIAIAEPDLS